MKRRAFLRNAAAAGASLTLAGCGAASKQAVMPAGVMPAKPLGSTGMNVSRLGFGSHLVQDLVKKPRLRDRMIKQGFERGINLFDVYDHSNYHQFEPMSTSVNDIGRKHVLVSLVAVNPTDTMQAEIDGALRTFRTDYIDLYRNHIVDDDRMDILVRSKKAGKIRAVGVVSHNRDDMMRYIDDYGDVLDYVMIIYNFHHNQGRFTSPDSYPRNDYSALLPRCERLGLGVIGIKPMGSDDMTKLARENGFFKNRDVSVSHAMLRQVFNRPEIDTTIPAMNSMNELAANLGAAYDPLTKPGETEVLKDLSTLAASTKRAYLRPHYKWLENWATRIV